MSSPTNVPSNWQGVILQSTTSNNLGKCHNWRMSREKAILVDVDGTVAIHKGRGPFDWSKLAQDSPNNAVIDVVNRVGSTNVKIIFITGRENKYRIETEKWLRKYISLPFILFCRTDNDFRKDEEIKKCFHWTNLQPLEATRNIWLVN